ncbi:HIT family protein [Natronoflexus pectinivorans]|uniref:Histidine triad (HIT) family protein n=1 Tax=Natronoflexus pectinivorans TaxID=682526 RepID=A0A4R2GNW4_9BACT|nr:HIT family protein [Natronoflexus pectinivorans]TCO10727.1 histidine triad (HIT) family protein [Natronoflexus pectinivorans]
MASIFTKIINGEIPSFKIAEDERYLAFLDITPLAKGHTLIVPKKEVDYIFDLEDDLLQGMIVFSKKVAKAIEKSIECKRIGIAVVGLEVPHAHVHLVPLQTVADLSFSKPKLKLSNEEMEQIAAAIKENIN